MDQKEILSPLKYILHRLKNKLHQGKRPENNVVTLSPNWKKPLGKVLFSYIIDGFLLNPKTSVPKTHTNIWQSVGMVNVFLELGYEVDVIHYKNQTFIPQEAYAFFVDVRHNMQRLTPLLNEDCVKIMHLDTANILFHNAAEAKRLLQLQQRRGITLKPKRFEMPNKGIEFADYGTTCGNDFTVKTFEYSHKKIFKLPSPCGIILDKPHKDLNQCRQKFLWFSSSGPVHKGLDLALEAFKMMPNYHLTVCGPVESDKDFVRYYKKELFETKNITTIGWIDVDSEKFLKITSTCIAALHLSCSEGGAPSVKMCMHAGLIPIVSYESGVDVEDFGFVLKNCTINQIKDIVEHTSSLPQSELDQMCQKAWQHATQHHTRENFSVQYHRVISEIINDKKENEYPDTKISLQ